MWHRITRSHVTIFLYEVRCFILDEYDNTWCDLLQEQQPIKFVTVWHFCKTFACYVRVCDVCMTLFWVTAVPLGAQPGQWRRVYVRVCVWESQECVDIILCACAHCHPFICVFICPMELPGPEHTPLMTQDCDCIQNWILLFYCRT